MSATADFAPIHPAEFFLEDFLKPLSMTSTQAARALQVPEAAVDRFLAEETPLTPDLALRLERAFGCTAEYWMRWQTDYDLRLARAREGAMLDTIHRVVAAE